MPSTKSFTKLRDEARRDPERARRIDAAKVQALHEQAEYRLTELRGPSASRRASSPR